MKLKGMDKVLRNLNKQVRKIEGRTREGMQEAGLFLKGEAQEITPQRLGVLVGSSFYNTDVVAKGPRLRVGYTAEYAPYVHEMPDGTNWTKPDTGNKFLEKAVARNTRVVLDILRDSARVR